MANKKIPKTPHKQSMLSKEDQIKVIEGHFKEILNAMGMDLTDDSIEKTPYRVAKMFVNELFTGLDAATEPVITVQSNKFDYSSMLIEINIDVKSVCEHHFQPIIGKAHIAYIPNKTKLVGLSKLNRVTEFYSKRPQVQERLTEQVQKHLQNALGTEDVAVVIDAEHFCVKMRGVEHHDCVTRTSALGGKFMKDVKCRAEFFASIPRIQK